MIRCIQMLMALGALIALSACGAHEQSVLDPVSPEAREISKIWWVMFVVCSLVFVAVIWFLLQAMLGKKGSQPPGGATRFVVGGGIVLPSIVLVGFLIYSLRVALVISPPEEGMTIEVDGYQWWWEVRYPEFGIVTANEIHLPVGERVRLRLRAHDVIHSFWVPNLHGKLDMFPDRPTTMWIQAEKPGVWRGQCAEFCGTQHALMAIVVVVLEPEEFELWVQERQAAAAAERIADSAGEALFFRHGCSDCHSIQGTEAAANIGPDLTHLGSRLTLAAAAVDNNPGNLAGWIADPQSIKPGSLMPPTYLEAGELQTLVDYLLSLDPPQ